MHYYCWVKAGRESRVVEPRNYTCHPLFCACSCVLFVSLSYLLLQTDEYILPFRRDTSSASVAYAMASAGDSPTSILMNAHMEPGTIDVCDENGDIVGEIEGRRLRF